MPFLTLISADSYRDGRSLECIFRVGPDRYEAVCLKANIFALEGIGKRYSDVYWFKGESEKARSFMNSFSNESPIQPGSDSERDLMIDLDRFFAHPVLEPELEPSCEVDSRISILKELIAGIPGREHFDRGRYRDALKIWQSRLTRR